jgi:virulence factor Mce-like protein
MVTQAPKTSNVLIAVLFILSCVGLMVFVWTEFGGSIPFEAQGYRVKATFSETGLLVPGADIRISGVNVGKVVGVDAKGINSIVTMDIKRQYAPIPADTRAILREKTLLGEAYVAISTGTQGGATLPDGGVIANSQVESTQALDQVLNSFNSQTQTDLQNLLNGTFAALAGRGQDLNDAIGNLDPAVTELTALVGVLNQQKGNVQRVVNDTGSVLGTLGNRSAALQTLVSAGNSVLSTTASRNAALTATVNDLPAFLTQLRTTLGDLNTTLGLAQPSLVALRPAAKDLPPALADLITLAGPAVKLLHAAPGLVRAADAALPAITRFGNAFKPAVDVLLPAAEQLVPMIDYIGTQSQQIVAGIANLGSVAGATAAASTTVATDGEPPGVAHYGRVLPILTGEMFFGATSRGNGNRANAYYAPGSQSSLASGLQSENCSGESGGGNVPCSQQAAVNWGNGIAPGYYPHLTAKPAP